MRSEKILHEKITHPRLKIQIVGPLLVALHAECYNMLNSCRLYYLHLVCNIPFANSTATWITRIVKQFAFLLWTSAKLLTL